MFCSSNQSNQIFHYAYCITPKRVPSLRGSSLSLRPGYTVPFEEMLQRWRAVGNTLSDLTGPIFESQTSRPRDESVAARPTWWEYFVRQ